MAMINPGTHIKIVVYYLENDIGKGWVYSQKKEIKIKLPEKYGIHAGTLFNCTISDFDQHNQCYSIQDGSVKILPDNDGAIIADSNSIKLRTNVLTHITAPQGTLWSPDFDFVDYSEETPLNMSMVYSTYVVRMDITKHNNRAHNDIIFTVVDIPKESEDKLTYAEELKEVERKVKEKLLFNSPASYAGQKGFAEFKGQTEANNKNKDDNSGRSKKINPMNDEKLMDTLKETAKQDSVFLIVKEARGDPNYGEAFGLHCHSVTVHNMRIYSKEESVQVGQWCEGRVKFDKQFFRSKRNLGFKVERINLAIPSLLETFVREGKVYVHVDLNMDKTQPIPATFKMKNHFVIRGHIILGDILIEPQLYNDAKQLCKKHFEDPAKVHAIVSYRNAYRDVGDFNMAWEVKELVDFMYPGYNLPQPEESSFTDAHKNNDRCNDSAEDSSECSDDDDDDPLMFPAASAPRTNRSPMSNSSPHMAYEQPYPYQNQELNREGSRNNGFVEREHVSHQGNYQEGNGHSELPIVIADSRYPALVTMDFPDYFIAYCCSQEYTLKHACLIPRDKYTDELRVGDFLTFEAVRLNKNGCSWLALTETIREFPRGKEPIINVAKGSVIMTTNIDRSKKYSNPAAALRVFTTDVGFVRSADIVPFAKKDVRLNMAVLLSKCTHQFVACEVRYDYMPESDEYCWRLIYIKDSPEFRFTDDQLDFYSSGETIDSSYQSNPANQKSDLVFVTDDELALLWKSKELKQRMKSVCYELYGRLEDRILFLRQKGYLDDDSTNSDTESSRVKSSVNQSRYSVFDSHPREVEDRRSEIYVQPSNNQFARAADNYTQRTTNHGFETHGFTDDRSYSRASSKLPHVSREVPIDSSQTMNKTGELQQSNGNATSRFSGAGSSTSRCASSQDEKKSTPQRRFFDTNHQYGRPGWGVKPATFNTEQSDERRF